jgi:predicted Zn-dependent protease
MNQLFSHAQQFSRHVKSFLDERIQRGELQSYSCTFEPAMGLSSSLISGKRHSKAPAQETFETELTLNLTLADGSSTMLEWCGLSLPDFKSSYERALRLAMPLKHDSKLVRYDSYPEVDLAAPELLAALSAAHAIVGLDEMAQYLDKAAARVENPRLMSREINTRIEANLRHYFDSIGNSVEEFSTHTEVAVSFSLSDSSEYQSDAFGHLPTHEELDALVDDVARRVVPVSVREFEPVEETAVLLTPRAFAALADDLLLPNIEARTLLDGSGAWDISKLFQTILPGVTIRDNPLLPRSPFSQRFDMEGTPSRPVVIVERGKLAHPLLTSSLLEELRAANPPNPDSFGLTGHAASHNETDETNLFIELEADVVETVEALRAGKRQVVVVTNLTGSSVDSITGQFALDAEGVKVFLDGKLQYSTNVTLRGNLLEALSDPKRRVGPQERVFDTYVPWLLTEKLSCVGKKLANEGN